MISRRISGARREFFDEIGEVIAAIPGDKRDPKRNTRRPATRACSVKTLEAPRDPALQGMNRDEAIALDRGAAGFDFGSTVTPSGSRSRARGPRRSPG